MRKKGDGSIKRGYAYSTKDGKEQREHRLIVERILGRQLPPKAVVHHVDENRLNNDPHNFVVCPDTKYHSLLHTRMNALRASGNANWRKCYFCHCHDDPKNLVFNEQKIFHFACRSLYNSEYGKTRRALEREIA